MYKKKPLLFDSDSLKNFHKRIFFSILVFLFFFFSVFYRVSFITISSYFDDSSPYKLVKEEIRGKLNLGYLLGFRNDSVSSVTRTGAANEDCIGTALPD